MSDLKPPSHSATQALIKRLRDRGLSQTEISRRTQIPQPRLSRWENGEVATGADDALKLQALEEQLAAATPEAKAWDGVDRRSEKRAA